MAKRQAGKATKRISDDALRARGFDPFVRPEHVKADEWLELTGFNSVDRGAAREQFKCEVRNERGETFILGVREGSPDHRLMHRALGANWREWRGAVQVTIADGSQGGKFVNVKSVTEHGPRWADTEPTEESEG